MARHVCAHRRIADAAGKTKYHDFSDISAAAVPSRPALKTAHDSLERFCEAQALIYATALAEISRGSKRGHWMWFIFPQMTVLGRSTKAKFYGINSVEEAGEYLDHPVLGPRYLECVTALQDLKISDPIAVFGELDAIKLKFSLTLFEAARPNCLFSAALDRWFGDRRDALTLNSL